MTEEIAALSRKVDLVLMRLDEINHTGKPGMKQCDFAKLIGVTPRTVCRMVKDRRVRLEKGVIPHEVVRKFLS